MELEIEHLSGEGLAPVAAHKEDVRVKVLEIDNRGRVKLSIKEAQSDEGTTPEAPAATAETAPEA